ncbi:hypothetical protein ABT095_18545 [Kitasatospora sp. NPDC002227]|uniref:hypothetical protein n=1 Tax=Kitasatospora sp. NPDC002227 TaxID=3154773 RepID=UPI00331D82F3
MMIETLLRELADEHIEYDWARPTEYQRAGDLRVTSEVVFSCPNPPEFSPCGDVPPGSHPVHVGFLRRQDRETGEEVTDVSLVFVPLAAPEVIAEAEFEDAIEDWQPLGPDLAFLWDSAAMDVLPEGFEDHVTAELAVPGPDGRGRAWADFLVEPATGLNVLAFPVSSESATCLAGRSADGTLVALLMVAEV